MMLVNTGIPFVVFNMGITDIWLTKETVMAHLDMEEVDISEVTTQTVYDSGYDIDSDENEEERLERTCTFFLYYLTC